jgi:dTDP-4-dehydrorhamnose reductase
LLTRCNGNYEPGLFDVRAAPPRATALTKIISEINKVRKFNHPVMEEKGWWKRDCRIIYEIKGYPVKPVNKIAKTRPLIITGKTGTLGNAFARICALRGISFILTGREDLDITDAGSITRMVQQFKPWAIINTAGFVRVDDAESESETCFLANTVAPDKLSAVCRSLDVKFVNFSSDLVFNGQKKIPYLESDLVSPLNIYGQSKARAEQLVMENHPDALIIRTSAFFGPWDRYNFIYHALNSFKQQQEFTVANDVTISPTYVPDLVNNTLDLLIDDEKGIWNLSNKGEITWDMLAREIAERTGFNPDRFKSVSIHDMNLVAPRPQYSVLTTERGFELPSLDNALGRYLAEQELLVL